MAGSGLELGSGKGVRMNLHALDAPNLAVGIMAATWLWMSFLDLHDTAKWVWNLAFRAGKPSVRRVTAPQDVRKIRS
jgi:hypothetical protein